MHKSDMYTCGVNVITSRILHAVKLLWSPLVRETVDFWRRMRFYAMCRRGYKITRDISAGKVIGAVIRFDLSPMRLCAA